MTVAEKTITENLDLWTSAIKSSASQGRGKSSKQELYGVKKLRELILELAVRGLIVSQISSEEPAFKLLERIYVEKQQLIVEKKIKKTKKLPEIQESEKFIDLPKGWEYSRLGDIVSIIRGITFPASEKNSQPADDLIACLRTANVQHHIDWEDLIYVNRKFVKRDEQILKVGDIVMSMANSRELVGKVSFTESIPTNNATFGGFLSVIRPYQLEARYLMFFMRAPHIKEQLIGSASQTTNIANISLEKLNPLVVAVPPLDEQKRIVAKVDELMALCDQLEQQQESSINAHQTLVETLLGALTNASAKGDFDTAWARIAEHFDTLFITEHSIDQLKQTILQLAVMGKLVPQDPNDEPASILLEKIESERNEWIEEHLATTPECRTMKKKLVKLEQAKEPFALPTSWECAHLIQLSRLLVDCHNKTAPYVESGIPIIRTSNIRNREFILNDLKFVNQETYQYWSRRCPPQGGDIMFTREAPMGEAAIIPDGEVWCLGQRTMLIRPMHDYIDNAYLLLALTEPHLLERASEHAVGATVKHLRVGDVENLNIPVPPLEEQRRIVKKVNELLEICDQLKNQINNVQATQLHLADTLADSLKE